jgi:nucleotide-binding universal stress UspA family protein
MDLDRRLLMEHLMVGVDGSKASERALRWAATMALRRPATVTAVYAQPGLPPELPESEHERWLAERAEILSTEWARPAVELGADVRTELLQGEPRTTLMAYAQDARPDLLVLGRSGHGGGPGFLHVGSLVEYAAHHVGCPLAVIPPEGDDEIHRIVLGADGSESAAAAAAWCARVAEVTGAEVLAVAVQEPVAEWTPSWDEKNWRRDTERDLASWAAPVIDVGVHVELLPTENLHPADGLLGVASDRGTDLIVIGTRGAGGFLGLRFGGVAMKVLHRTTDPLVLVPPVES